MMDETLELVAAQPAENTAAAMAKPRSHRVVLVLTSIMM
jgi:hypothetical protein